LVAVVNASETQAALGFTVFSITMVSVRFGGEFLIPKLGRVLAARLSGLLAAIGALIAVTGIRLETVLLGFALMGCGYALIMPLVFSRAAEQGATGAGLNIAKVATLAYGGMLLGPPLIGFIADDFGFQVAFAVIAALAGIVFLLATALRPQ
jgi:MFS family permease